MGPEAVRSRPEARTRARLGRPAAFPADPNASCCRSPFARSCVAPDHACQSPSERGFDRHQASTKLVSIVRTHLTRPTERHSLTGGLHIMRPKRGTAAPACPTLVHLLFARRALTDHRAPADAGTQHFRDFDKMSITRNTARTGKSQDPPEGGAEPSAKNALSCCATGY